MYLTLVRHGEALGPGELGDFGRILSQNGRQQIRDTGAALASRNVCPSLVLCSPLVRAVQTAELLAAELAHRDVIGVRRYLQPDGAAGQMLEELATLGATLEGAPDILVAGHEPMLSIVTSAVLGARIGGYTNGAAYRLRLDRPEPGGGQLVWHYVGRFVE